VTATPLHARADAAASAEVRQIDGRRVVWFRVAGGPHHGAIGIAGGATVERAVALAGELGLPLVGELDSAGAELNEHVAALHAWGRIARALTNVSGQVPMLVAVTGACVSGPALIIGLFDVVLMTEDAFAYVSGPDAATEFTGVPVDRVTLGGASVHAKHSGVSTLLVADDEAARDVLAHVLSYLPEHHLSDPPVVAADDPPDRSCDVAATAIPDRPTESYDVHAVIEDVCDAESFFELRPLYAPIMITGLARLDGRAIGVVANVARQRAGAIDIEASRKAARFVAMCDAFNLPIVTFVDTPGFEPGRDLEWRGMIRHGAELVHAYSAATVPRLCVVMRKAFGGAYIVMDSRGIANDLCVAWPTAEIAVMGAPAAVKILHGRRLALLDGDDAVAEEQRLVTEYETVFSNPYRASELGLVDAVIAPGETRRVLCDALEVLATKRDHQPRRRHSNTPL
jgi:acetyl-CoA carboxylase carboxyltransferase component